MTPWAVGGKAASRTLGLHKQAIKRAETLCKGGLGVAGSAHLHGVLQSSVLACRRFPAICAEDGRP